MSTTAKETLSDDDGNIVCSIDISGKKEYNYEYEEGRIVRATESDITLSGEIVTSKVIVNTVKYYYDTEGKMTKKVITPTSGTAQTIYYETNDDNTVVKFSAGGRTVTSHSKTDSFGRKVFDELQLGTDFVSRQFVYHAGKVTAEHKTNAKVKSSATTQLVSQIILSDGHILSYEYDAEERITAVSEKYNIGKTEITDTTSYTYDALGQLLTETNEVKTVDKSVEPHVTTVTSNLVNSMEYDNYGNITKKNDVVYTYGDTAWKDKLTKVGTKEISYDDQGNPLTYLGNTLSWEKGRQLKKLVKPDGTTIGYTYNANGIRTIKTVNGVTHTYTLDGTKILREVWGDNTLVPLYDNEDGICGITYNDIPYYFIKNLQGDVIAIVDKDAQTVARYAYDAWGECTVTQDSVGIATINPFRYRTYYFDEEIELYYLQSRYYSPGINRFVSSDSAEFSINGQLAHKINGFSYCENSPIIRVDSAGNESTYIYNQQTFWAASMKIGNSKTTVAEMGCGYVAVYNVMHRFSSKIKFSKVLSSVYYSGGLINYLYNRNGKNGASLFSIVDYLRSKFIRVRYMIGFSKLRWRYISDFSDAIIVSYFTSKGNGHYVAGIKEKYDFRFYNCFLPSPYNDLSKRARSIDSFFTQLDACDRSPSFIVGVKYKKFWW